jgi:hypothetical protein
MLCSYHRVSPAVNLQYDKARYHTQDSGQEPCRRVILNISWRSSLIGIWRNPDPRTVAAARRPLHQDGAPRGVEQAFRDLSVKGPMSGHAAICPESCVADGKPDRIIDGRQSGRPPCRSGGHGRGEVRDHASFPARPWAAPINLQNPTPPNVQNDSRRQAPTLDIEPKLPREKTAGHDGHCRALASYPW